MKPDRRKPPRKTAKSIANSHTSPAVVSLTLKQAQALDLRLQGCGYKEIAERMDTVLSAAFKYVDDALSVLKDVVSEKAEALRSMELQRLDRMQAAVYRRAVNQGNPAAINAVLKIMERRAKLMGLDEASKTQIDTPNGQPLVTGIQVMFVAPGAHLHANGHGSNGHGNGKVVDVD